MNTHDFNYANASGATVSEPAVASDQKTRALLGYVYLYLAFTHAPTGLLRMLTGVPFSTMHLVFGIGGTCLHLFNFWLNRRGHKNWAVTLLIAEQWAHHLLSVSQVGFGFFSFAYWYFVPVLIFLTDYKLIVRFAYAILIAAFSSYILYLGWDVLRPAVAGTLPVAIGSHLMLIITISYISFIFGRLVQDSERRLSEEHALTRTLLHSILPTSLAETLRHQHRTIVQHYDSVTVFFADIVGFTPLAERLSPEETIRMLNDIFSAIDDLVDRHGLEKIKTVGDAYMAVAGLPEETPDHGERAARLALGIAEILRRTPGAKGQLRMRVGLHTGPVTAGVIGKKKFAYDLWGDTVNTASRMESHGLPGRIQVSKEVYENLKDKFKFERRGRIKIKGKATQTTWFLTGEK